MSNRKTVFQEINREQDMRRKVWKMSGGYFVKVQEQRQYDNMQLAADILSVMTDGEFERYKTLLARKQGSGRGDLEIFNLK